MDGTAVDKKHLVFSLDHAYEISTAIQIVCSLSKNNFPSLHHLTSTEPKTDTTDSAPGI